MPYEGVGCIKHVNITVYTNDTVRRLLYNGQLNQVTLLYSDPFRQVLLYNSIIEVLCNHKCSKIPIV